MIPPWWAKWTVRTRTATSCGAWAGRGQGPGRHAQIDGGRAAAGLVGVGAHELVNVEEPAEALDPRGEAPVILRRIRVLLQLHPQDELGVDQLESGVRVAGQLG